VDPARANRPYRWGWPKTVSRSCRTIGLSRTDGQLLAWGLATPLKLLPDAAQYFPELRGCQLGLAMNGEPSNEVDPERVFGLRRSFCCEPRWPVFLERTEQPGYSLVRMAPQEAAARLEFDLEDLPQELCQVRKPRGVSSRVSRSGNAGCFGTRRIRATLLKCSPVSAPTHWWRRCSRLSGLRALRHSREGDQTLWAFHAYPVATLWVAGHAVRLETNSLTIPEQLTDAIKPRAVFVGAGHR
jgi:hypothetical protein